MRQTGKEKMMLDKMYKNKNDGRLMTGHEMHEYYLDCLAADLIIDYGFADFIDGATCSGTGMYKEMTAFEAAADVVQNSLYFKLIDYTDHEPGKESDGGGYATGYIYKKFESGWGYRPWTTGDYCPECRSFSCSGCWEWREIAAAAAVEEVTDWPNKNRSIVEVQWL